MGIISLSKEKEGRVPSEEMEPDDPFGQSDSDESSSDPSGLYPSDIPVDVAGIVMVSPPGPSEGEEVPHRRSTTLDEDQEIFHTPPESRSNSTSSSFDNCLDDRMIGCGVDSEGGNEIVDADCADSRRIVDAGCADSGKIVDLGRDTDLVFSEVEVVLSQRVQADLNPDEEIRVSKRGFSPEEQSAAECLSKKLKSLDFELPTEPLGAPKELMLSDQIKVSKKGFSPEEQGSTECLSKKIMGLDFEFPTEPLGTRKELILGNQVRDSGEKGSNPCVMEKKSEVKRALPSWANIGREKERTIESDRVKDSGKKNSNPCGIEKKSEAKRALPSLANIAGVGDDESVLVELDNNDKLSSSALVRAEEDNERTGEKLYVNERETIHLDTSPDNLNNNVENITLLDVLKILDENLEEEDSDLECLNLFELAQRKWGTTS